MAAEMNVDLTKTFPDRTPIRARLRYSTEASGILILFGPSGSGKTTVLRSLAGLEWPEQGLIQFSSDTWLDTAQGIRVSPQARRIGYMAQDYALFPTYTVAGNIAYGLGTLSTADRSKRIDDMIDLFQLRSLSGARPHELSGGQQQRVALARAVASRPQLLLLDEPLSALDVPTRLQLRGELRALLKQLAIPSIIVTHDWAEALSLGDRMAVMSQGTVMQTGTPQEVFSRPANAEVARVVGVETVVQGTIVRQGEELATVQVGTLSLTALATPATSADVFVCIRAEDVTLELAGSAETSARNHVSGPIRTIVSLGPMAQVTMDCGFPLTALITRSAMSDLGLDIGVIVTARFKAGAVHLVPRQ